MERLQEFEFIPNVFHHLLKFMRAKLLMISTAFAELKRISLRESQSTLFKKFHAIRPHRLLAKGEPDNINAATHS